ncbi:MAG: MopE-related protein, partial [Bacteroidota bacterium]
VYATQTWYLDADNDGHYVSSQSSCASPGASYNLVGGSLGDCDDGNGTKWQSASLYIDTDNDGYDAGLATVCYGANIPAGYISTTLGSDCRDNDAAIHAPVQYYVDGDRDGFGSTATSLICSLTATTGYSTNNSDCDDTRATVYPGAPELCDGLDNNCNGQIDETGCAVTCSNATGLNTTNITSTSATLNWSAPVDPAQWQVQYKSVAPGSKWKDVAPAPLPAARSVTILGLTAGQSYNWHIKAKCGNTWTSYTNSLTFKTLKNSSPSARSSEINITQTEESIPVLRLYPNPSRGEFMIDLRVADSKNEPANFELIDVTGRTVYTGNAAVTNGLLQKKVIVSPLLSPGVYMIRVKSGNRSYVSKLVYEK